MIFQRTIAESIAFSGIGLHTGNRINVTLRPADANNGIIFHRKEGERTVSIEACSDNVVDTRLATVIGKGDLKVSTVEHLMATLYAFGIDNLHIDIDGPEVPIMDGSAGDFVEMVSKVDLVNLSVSRKYLAIRKPISVIDGEKRISIIPSRLFRVTSDIAFDHPSIALQNRSIKLSPDVFSRDIARARTFGFLNEVEYLKANGLARGGSLDNAVVIDDNGVVNPDGLRYSDEFVRHKILDTIGDFSLTGYPILGHVRTYKAGHDINHKTVQKILASPDCWQIVEFSDEDLRLALQKDLSTTASNHLAFEKI
ncbi:MAG: UDP-3-O-[3-hydroxymyristoyl] N-acetylglucosamine deacetylase [Desulfuromonas sp.]|nr:MAG: UDP-3-O-[3-hydroxymyristoyl] N-acetylglucosamine deacetylase [Desulfuromonas sp.]